MIIKERTGIGIINTRGLKKLGISFMKPDHCYEFYIGHILQLFRLGYIGMLESEEADLIRDELDLYWRHLSKEEIDKVEEFIKTLTDKFPTPEQRKFKEILD